jgi:hypothetical protein
LLILINFQCKITETQKRLIFLAEKERMHGGGLAGWVKRGLKGE